MFAQSVIVYPYPNMLEQITVSTHAHGLILVAGRRGAYSSYF